MFQIDEAKRRIIINSDTSMYKTEPIIVNEFDKLKRKFLPGTEDIFECELVLLEVDKQDPVTGKKIEGKELKAYARRVDKPYWLMLFDENEYVFEFVISE